MSSSREFPRPHLPGWWGEGWELFSGLSAAFTHLRIIASIHLKNHLAFAIKDQSRRQTISMPATSRLDLPRKTSVH